MNSISDVNHLQSQKLGTWVAQFWRTQCGSLQDPLQTHYTSFQGSLEVGRERNYALPLALPQDTPLYNTDTKA